MLRGSCIALEEGVLGFRVESSRRFVEHDHKWFITHETSGKCDFLPLSKRNFDTSGPGRPKLSLETPRKAFHHVRCAGTINSASYRTDIIQPRHVTHSYTVPRTKFESKEILKCPAQALSPCSSTTSSSIRLTVESR